MMIGRTYRITCFSGILFSMLVCAAAFAQSPPPSNLHQEGDHWTAWNPPPTGEGQEVYIIQSGDTLWSIARARLGDPYLWPQIWERNQYILDAHWIYPGDPLVMSGTGLADSSGVAGPDPHEGNDPGTLWIVLHVNGASEALNLTLPFDRERIRQFTCIMSLNMLRTRLVGDS